MCVAHVCPSTSASLLLLFFDGGEQVVEVSGVVGVSTVCGATGGGAIVSATTIARPWLTGGARVLCARLPADLGGRQRSQERRPRPRRTTLRRGPLNSKACSQISKMKNKIATATKGTVGSFDGLKPISLPVGDIPKGGTPDTHGRCFLCSSHSQQKHFPFLFPPHPAEKHSEGRTL